MLFSLSPILVCTFLSFVVVSVFVFAIFFSILTFDRLIILNYYFQPFLCQFALDPSVLKNIARNEG